MVQSRAALSRYCLWNVKVRLEQVLMSEPGPATLYKLGNLIKFYQGTVGLVYLCDDFQVMITFQIY